MRNPRCISTISRPEGFEWLDCHTANDSVLSFLRKGKTPQDALVVVLQFHARRALRLPRRRSLRVAGTKKCSIRIRSTTLAAMSGIFPDRRPTRRMAWSALVD